MLSRAEQSKLLGLVRRTITERLTGKAEPGPVFDEPVFREKRGAFVTLHDKNGQLRGCIGLIEGFQPLANTIREMSLASAFEDPRFSPLSAEELPDVKIEISVLTPLKRVKDASEIKLGEYGVVVKRAGRSGVFLPQVATETGWTREEFLSHLCAGKAGLEPDAWKNPGTELYVFSAQVFRE